MPPEKIPECSRNTIDETVTIAGADAAETSQRASVAAVVRHFARQTLSLVLSARRMDAQARARSPAGLEQPSDRLH